MMDEADKLKALSVEVGRAAQEHYEYILGIDLPYCESPIERVMLAALLASAVSDVHSKSPFPTLWRPEMLASAELRERFIKGDAWNPMMARQCIIAPQFHIGDYRVDFCLGFFGDHEDDCVFHLVVECDGHEWHERTPDQAQRDKARDRAIQSAGFHVLRFTGREIWRDPLKCAGEVYQTAAKEMYRRLGIATE